MQLPKRLTAANDWLLARDPQNVGKREGWYASGPAPDALPAPVPGLIQQVYPDYHGVAWYWLRFTAAAAPDPSSRVLVRFHGGVDYLGEVWLNGQFLGGCEGGEAPFDLDATGALRPEGENLLAVRVLNPTYDPIDGFTLKETPHRNKVMPFKPGSTFNFGGIMQRVELCTVPAVRIAGAFVRPDPHTGRVPMTVTFRNDTPQAVAVRVVVTIGPAASGGASRVDRAESTLALPPGETPAEYVLKVDRPHLWNLDDPFLYRVSIRLQTCPDPAAETAGLAKACGDDEYTVRCGFRELKVERGFFRLNGKRIFLRSTHTGNHMPQGQVIPQDPDLVRRDLIMAKATGFNTIRYIVGMALPEQLDFADELGMLMYEECTASWCLVDSPRMEERFDRNTDAMILRDRNHPSLAIWGLLNETRDGAVFRRAVAYLPRLRALDPTRLVLLSSGRWDCQWNIGSLSNPGGTEWEYAWGAEAPGAEPVPWDGIWKTDDGPGGYCRDAGDAHVYPRTPHTDGTLRFLRTLGRDTKPVFLSEYGIGSLMNVIRELRHFEQAGARPDLPDVAFIRSVAGRLAADWERWGFDGVYASPEDMLWDSQRLMARQRLLGFDLIRANPQICGFNLTGILDHGITGEGLWTFHREWKPGVADALSDGWAPVRWCLFADPEHGYAGRPIRLEAVLANEDVLPPGRYPATFRIAGAQGVVWEKRTELLLPEPAPGEDPPLAVSALAETVQLDLPAGAYEFRAYLERGGAPAGGHLTFYVSDGAALPRVETTAGVWGIEPAAADWLCAHGVTVHALFPAKISQEAAGRELILVGMPPEDERDAPHWAELARRMAAGDVVLFLVPEAFARGEETTAWLPLAVKGRCYKFNDWLYHKECVAKAHPAFAGLGAGPAGRAQGILDWDFYGQVIPHFLFDLNDPARGTSQPAPDDIAAAAFAPCALNYEGYTSGILLGSYDFGAGRFTINTFPLLENLGRHPAADRILLNLIGEMARECRVNEGDER